MDMSDRCGAQGIVGSMPWIAFGWLTLYMQMLVSCLTMAACWLPLIPLELCKGFSFEKPSWLTPEHLHIVSRPNADKKIKQREELVMRMLASVLRDQDRWVAVSAKQ